MVCFNSPVWFNVGLEEQPAVLGVLHQRGRRHDAVDPRAGQDRGHAVQVGLGHRLEPVDPALVARAPRRRRHGLGPGLVHARLRRLRRRDQERRQDPAGGEDGDPERRSPGHRRVHRLQGGRGAQGLGADRRRLRRRLQRPGRRLRFGLLPERQPLGARHRRLHAGGDRRRRVADPGGDRQPACRDPQGEGPDGSHRSLDLAVRRSRHAVRHDDQRLAHLSRDRADQCHRTRAASTCSSTTRPATWHRSI